MELSIITAMLLVGKTLDKFAGDNIYIAVFTTITAIASFYYFKK